MLRNVELVGYTVLADKGFASADFEALMRELGAIFLRPDRKGEPAGFGRLGGMRQWVESVFGHSHEQHGAHGMPGLMTRIAQRLLGARRLHLAQLGAPATQARHLTAYDH